MKKIIIFSLAFYILYSIFYIPPVYAEGVSLAISPPLITVQTAWPALIEKAIRLENKGNSTINLDIKFLPFSQRAESSGIPNYQTTPYPDLIKKVQLFDDGDSPIQEITLSPKQQKDLVLKINLSENENNSDYYFSIVFVSKNTNSNETLKESQNVTAITTIQPGIATNILLSIFTGKKQPEGIIETYSAPLFATKGPIPFTLTFVNTGSFLLIPQGTILISNMFGQTVGKIPVPPTYVLANTKRNIQLSWDEPIIFGPYTATLYLNYADNKNVSFKKPLAFIGLPLTALGSIIGAIIAIVLLRNRLKKHTD